MALALLSSPCTCISLYIPCCPEHFLIPGSARWERNLMTLPRSIKTFLSFLSWGNGKRKIKQRKKKKHVCLKLFRTCITKMSLLLVYKSIVRCLFLLQLYIWFYSSWMEFSTFNMNTCFIVLKISFYPLPFKIVLSYFFPMYQLQLRGHEKSSEIDKP